MCGITGYVNSTKKLKADIIEKMTSVIQHRGPDSFGTKSVSSNNYHLAMGHRRLSILDISSDGHQPMNYKHLWIVYNGEVYNFKEIKEELIGLGHSFNSQSDTEVILHAFDAWGNKAVHKFIGMFAFSIFNEKENKLFIYRDRTGVKPLYYYSDKEHFMFASELKCFHENPLFKKEINNDALAQFFKYNYIHAPNTIFKNTYKLLPGHYIEFDLNSFSFSTHQYWNVLEFYEKPKLNISYEEAKVKLKSLMQDAFKLRMVSDVPVGVFLSGGYDSSTVTAILQKEVSEKLKTFTIAFDVEKYDESKYAEEVANILKTEHHTFTCTEKEALEILPDLPLYYDEPFADPSIIPTLFLSQKTKEKVTVSLSADGGDELFFGYNHHARAYKYYKRLKRLGIFSKFVNAFTAIFKNNKFGHVLYTQNAFNKNLSVRLQHIILMNYKDSFIKKIFRNNIKTLTTNFEKSSFLKIDKFHRILAVDYTTFLPDNILMKVDRATMAASLEGREPLLDHRIAEFAAQLPFEYLYNKETKTKKHILRDICHDYLPKELMSRKKTGFTPPIVKWLKTDLKEFTENLLSEKELNKHGLLDNQFIKKGLDEFLKGNKKYFKLVWNTVVFQLWYNKWMQND